MHWLGLVQIFLGLFIFVFLFSYFAFFHCINQPGRPVGTDSFFFFLMLLLLLFITIILFFYLGLTVGVTKSSGLRCVLRPYYCPPLFNCTVLLWIRVECTTAVEWPYHF